MKQGGKNLSNESVTGFTIVETMIVLSITAILAVSALALLTNRQHTTQFTVAVNNAKQQIQQIFNETASGYFPQSSNVSCYIDSSTGNLKLKNAASSQGSNVGCVFLGKALAFVTPTPGSYITYPITGLQTDSMGNSITSLADDQPTAVAAGTHTNATNPDDGTPFSGLEQSTPIQDSLTVQALWYCPGNCATTKTNIGAFAYLSLLNINSSASGSQQFGLFGIKQTGDVSSPVSSTGDMVDKLDDAANYDPAQEVGICLTDGGNHSALIQIGAADNSQSSVTSYQYTTGDCT